MSRGSIRALIAGSALVVLAVLFLTAWLIINTTFMLYDDEGYVLIGYRNFIEGERLYDDIFSQYGPFPYIYHWLVSTVLHTPLTHMLGRTLTALHWTGSALLAGALAFRLTRHGTTGLFAALATFGLLWQINQEPSHPGSLICLVLAAAAYSIISALDRRRWNWLATITGVTATVLLLTKINVGALFVVGAAAGALLVGDWPSRWRKPTVLLAVVGLIALPWLLMGARLEESWVRMLAFQFSFAAAGMVWVASARPTSHPTESPPMRTWSICAVVAITALTTICTIVLLRGTSVEALFRTIVKEPFQFPSRFIIGLRWHESSWLLMAGCIFIAAVAGWQLRRQGALSRWVRWTVIALRLAAAVLFLSNLRTWVSIHGVGGFANYCLPLLPAFLIRLREAGSNHLLVWASCLAMPQILHIYPVAGSQLGWGTFLFVPLLTAGLHDACGSLGRWSCLFARWVPRVLLAASVAQVTLLLHTGWERYVTSKPLGLPGAEDIRVGDHARMILRLMTLNACVHADVLFSRPGMYSYNLWSNVPTPTSRNATHWFTLLSETDQAAIIDRLDATPRNAVITSRPLDDFLASVGVSIESPLHRHIVENHRPLFEISGFGFHVPVTSRAVPFGLAELYVSSESRDPAAPALIQTHVALAGRPANVRVAPLNTGSSVAETYAPSRVRITLEPINANGDPLGPPLPLTGAEDCHGLYRLRIYTPATSPAPPHTRSLEVLNAHGDVLAEALF